MKNQEKDTAQVDTADPPPPPPTPSDEPDTAEEWTPPVHCVIIMPVDIWGRHLEVSWTFDEPTRWSEAESPWEGGMQVALDENSQLLLCHLGGIGL